MKTFTSAQARKEFNRILDEVFETNKPVRITEDIRNAVLICEDKWKAIQETLYLSSISGMQESIIEGLQTPVEDADTDLDWSKIC